MKYYDPSNKLFVAKARNEIVDVVIEEFVALKSKTYSFLVDGSGEHKKKAKDRNKDVNDLLNKKYLMHS